MGGTERTGAGIGRGAGREHVVDEHDRNPSDGVRGPERVGEIRPSCGGVERGLCRCGAMADERPRREGPATPSRQCRGEEQRLIVAALSQPCRMKRDGYQHRVGWDRSEVG